MPEMLADEQILDEVSTHPFQSEGDLALTDEIFVDSLIRTQQGLWRRLAPLRATLRNTRGLKKVQVGIGIAVGLVFTLIIMLVGAFVQWWPLIEILADELHPGLARSALDLIVPGSVSVDAFHLYGIYIAGIGIFLTNIIVYLMALVAIKNAAISRTLERMAYVASRGSFISQMRNFLVGVIAITFSYASLTLHWASLSDSGFFVDREIVWEFSRFDVVRFYLRSFFETLTLGISEQFGHLTFFGLSALESNKENILFSILILSYKFLVGLGLVPVVLFLLGSVRRGRASAREILNSAQYTSSRQGGNLLTTRSVLDGIVKRFAE
ncbi:MAG TPA: hypothetical protein DDZ68_15030 [Parvularcula sp.]|nr:hypothetical protein [Parvularcula sp.]